MNTPAHVVVNRRALPRAGSARPPAAPIVWGALVPDVPMFVFYVIEKGWLLRSEAQIWSQDYFSTSWQDFFDVFNSFPLVAAGVALAATLRSRAWGLFFLSMGLHAAFDLPLHHDDAHRHFLPLSDFRFASPLSYWDPAHYGGWIGLAEAAVALAGAVVLWHRFADSRGRWWLLAVFASYGSVGTCALLFFGV